jgi:F-type H+-transporting ATPase subunit a
MLRAAALLFLVTTFAATVSPLKGNVAVAQVGSTAQDVGEELKAWDQIKRSNDVAELKALIARYKGNTFLIKLAKRRIEQLDPQSAHLGDAMAPQAVPPQSPGMPDPIHQFEIRRIVPIKIFGVDMSITNSSAFMLVAVFLIANFFIMSQRLRSLVPTRMQSMAEISYEFVARMLRDSAGPQGMKYLPLVFTLFTFIFTTNMLGMIPGFFTVTSHIIVTAAMAALVFLTVLLVGFTKHGLRFLKTFVPDGIPILILPLVVLIEIISFLSQPVSHSVRLFANMLAGHITLKVFGGFVVMLVGGGVAYSVLAPLPLLMTIAMTALEVLVAFLQAYVFTMLTCMYLNRALHPGH